MNTNLCLHCGSRKVERSIVAQAVVPASTESWVPIPHTLLLQEVETNLGKRNMRIVNESFALTPDERDMFGLLQVANCQDTKDYAYVLGLRNSNSKKFPAGVAVGSSVFVCDNLAFSSEIVFARKHTTNIIRDLPTLVETVISQLSEKWNDQESRFAAYRQTELTNKEAMVLLMEAAEAEVFPWQRGWDIYQEWKTPRHPEFKERNVWSFFNAVTENLKPRKDSKATSLWSLPNRSARLHQLCDDRCGVVLGKKTEPTTSDPINPVI